MKDFRIEERTIREDDPHIVTLSGVKGLQVVATARGYFSDRLVWPDEKLFWPLSRLKPSSSAWVLPSWVEVQGGGAAQSSVRLRPEDLV